MKIGILGGGGWGTSLALHLYRKKFDITIWFHSEETLKLVKETRENIYYLPGFIIPNEILLTNEIDYLIDNSEIIFIVVPSQHTREVLLKIDKNKIRNKIFLIASKGIEMKTGKRMSEVLEEVLETKNYGVLSGPNFSKEVALRIPTSSVVASNDEKLSETLQNILTNEYFRVYTSRDSIGVELGGSLKNVLAIAAGISDGLGFGANTKASLITRGIKEMVRVGRKFGAKEETFYGLSGLGDLVATSFSNLSRNRWFGEMIGRGIKPKDIVSTTKQVIEGIYTAKVVFEKNRDLDLPIMKEVYYIIYENKDPIISVRNLMTRILKSEEN